MSDQGNDLLAKALKDNIVVMQAAWIEWKHGGGAEAAMEWIHNTLYGPGLIPEGEHDQHAQRWFDANRANPMPKCWCGLPSNIYSPRDGAACSEAHLLRQEVDGE